MDGHFSTFAKFHGHIKIPQKSANSAARGKLWHLIQVVLLVINSDNNTIKTVETAGFATTAAITLDYCWMSHFSAIIVLYLEKNKTEQYYDSDDDAQSNMIHPRATVNGLNVHVSMQNLPAQQQPLCKQKLHKSKNNVHTNYINTKIKFFWENKNCPHTTISIN